MCFLTAPVSPANDYSEPEGSETVQGSIESDLLGDVSEPLPESQGIDPETNTPRRNSSFDAGDIVNYVCDTCGRLLSTAGIYAGDPGIWRNFATAGMYTIRRWASSASGAGIMIECGEVP